LSTSKQEQQREKEEELYHV